MTETYALRAGEIDDLFEALVDAALADIPEPFQGQLSSVAVIVRDEPTPEELAQSGARGLFGLYTGVPRTAYGAEHATYPARIAIFRGEHLRAYHSLSALRAGVTDTVRHEVAHHLGISDTRLVELARRSPNR
jgi:predicted Zn-dependent protease with MMP-like domain